MNCNDCGGFLPRGCECSPFGGRRRDDDAYRKHQQERMEEVRRHDAEQAKPKLRIGPSREFIEWADDFCKRLGYAPTPWDAWQAAHGYGAPGTDGSKA